jgi:hypothetical protein
MKLQTNELNKLNELNESNDRPTDSGFLDRVLQLRKVGLGWALDAALDGALEWPMS